MNCNETYDTHKDLLFCPIHEKPPGSKYKKLLATLCDKKKYVIHYSYLKLAKKHWLKVKKVHKELQFSQKPCLRTYNKLNTRKRAEATNDFGKNFHKLMVNSVYGKTMENVRKRCKVKNFKKYQSEMEDMQQNF